MNRQVHGRKQGPAAQCTRVRRDLRGPALNTEAQVKQGTEVRLAHHFLPKTLRAAGPPTGRLFFYGQLEHSSVAQRLLIQNARPMASVDGEANAGRPECEGACGTGGQAAAEHCGVEPRIPCSDRWAASPRAASGHAPSSLG